MIGSTGPGTLTPPRPSSAETIRAGAPMAASPSGRARQRRWGVALVGALAMVVGAWGFAQLWLAAGDRVEAVALATDVEAYEELDRGDLVVVRVAQADGVDFLPAAELHQLVGRTVRADLPARSLLVEADLFPDEEALVADHEAVVGARIPEGAVPVDLARGREVMVVIRPVPAERGSGAPGGSPRPVDAWVLAAKDVDAGAGRAGGMEVSVVVPRVEATEVADAAADGRLSIVALEE